MRRWLVAATSSTGLVAERPELWLPGALAWVAGLGWLTLLVAVVPAPSAGDLTFMGARLFSSGAWPWNAVLIAAALLGLALLASLLVAAGEAELLALAEGRRAPARDTLRIAAVGGVAIIPTALLLVATVVGIAAVAPNEFNSPDPAPGPLVRIAARLAPVLVALGLAMLAAGAYSAVASRLAIEHRVPVATALRAAPGRLLRAGSVAVVHLLAAAGVRVVYLLLATLLLVVLWDPIGAQLATDVGIDLALGLLLVGFVAIWLCLVLGGGALRAWESVTWTRLLAEREPGPDRKEQTTHS